MKFLLRKYFIVIFAVATLLGVLHHHDDFGQHNNCQVCLVKSNLSHADAPADAFTLPDPEFIADLVTGYFHEPVLFSFKTALHPRAPPYIV